MAIGLSAEIMALSSESRAIVVCRHVPFAQTVCVNLDAVFGVQFTCSETSFGVSWYNSCDFKVLIAASGG